MLNYSLQYTDGLLHLMLHHSEPTFSHPFTPCVHESMLKVTIFLLLFMTSIIYGQKCCPIPNKKVTTTTYKSILNIPTTEYLVDSRQVVDEGYKCIGLKEPIFCLQTPCGFSLIIKDECEKIKGIALDVSHKYPLHDDRISKYESPNKHSGAFTKLNSTTWVFEWPTVIVQDKDFIYYQINFTLTNGTVNVLADRVYVLRFNSTPLFRKELVYKNRVIHVG